MVLKVGGIRLLEGRGLMMVPGGGGEDGLGGGWLLVEIRGAVDMKGPVLRLKSAAMVRERMREILLEEQI